MIIPVAGLVLLLLPALLGGRLSRLVTLRIRSAWLLPVALLMQVVALAVGSSWPVPASVVHIASYVVAGVSVWLNLSLPGLWLIALGALSNGVTIAVNGGTLPARPEALRTAGLAVDVDAFANSGALSHPRLWFLGDVFAVPSSVPLANVFSVGDILILAGVLLAAVRICGTRWTPAFTPVVPLPAGIRPPSGSDNRR